jgi:hypothetical protein
VDQLPIAPYDAGVQAVATETRLISPTPRDRGAMRRFLDH